MNQSRRSPRRSVAERPAGEATPLPARILDGRAVAAEIWAEVEADAADLKAGGVVPRLALLRVGDDPASVWYQRQIARAFSAHGLSAEAIILPADSHQASIPAALERLAGDPTVHGILLQLPLPSGLRAEPLVESLPRDKDVEGLQPYHVGRLALGRPTFVPSTPLAGLEIVRRSGIELSGRLAVVIGRSPIIGRPLANLLIQADCTVITCHTRTRDLAALTRQAQLLFAAAGRAGLIRGEMLSPGVAVVDFGTTEVEGRLVGDVDFDSAVEVASAVTPVPGGTGPVTTAVLARNLLQATRSQQG